MNTFAGRFKALLESTLNQKSVAGDPFLDAALRMSLGNVRQIEARGDTAHGSCPLDDLMRIQAELVEHLATLPLLEEPTLSALFVFMQKLDELWTSQLTEVADQAARKGDSALEGRVRLLVQRINCLKNPKHEPGAST